MSDLSFAQLQDSKPVRLEKNGQAICVARVGEEVFALADTCTHAEASLADGDIKLKTYAVRVDGDSVTIEI
jgi:3-phenylpropionate/trans-cinnamate dioxygenase ferredoxin component